MSRLPIAATLLVLGLAVPVQASGAVLAPASGSVLAPAPDVSGITAYAGQVVLSQLDPSTNRWALVRYANGALQRLPVAERSVPFDVDAGPDAAGKPVVVYSRCTREPTLSGGSLEPTLDWETASGCDLYELALTGTPTEHRVAATTSPGASETTPSIWRGNLAFVRHRAGQAVPTIEYLAAGASAPRHLGGGSVQFCGQSGAGNPACDFDADHDTVDQLDLGPSRVAYLWSMHGGFVYGVGNAYELRAASLAGGPSTLLDTGVIGGVCSFSLPNSPTATPGAISYLEADAPCGATQTSFATANPATGIRGLAPTPGGLAAAAVRDANTIYWLRTTGSPDDLFVPGGATCTIPGAGCQLVASPVGPYAAQPARNKQPEAAVDPVQSGLGYAWVSGPAGTELLRPPATIPCAPSAETAFVDVAARWSHGRHTVRVSRRDPNGTSRSVAVFTSSVAEGNGSAPRLAACGDSTRLTYAVTTGRTTQHVSFTVRRQ